jgi:predicted aldo/keto reductase-like oxidoreductase
MKHRVIPDIDIRSSVIGMGCANIASLSNPIPKQRALSTLRSALDNGINFFDTADSYGQGRSEQLIGEAFKDDRHKVIIATKVGHTFGVAGKSAALFKNVIKTAARYIPGVGKVILRLRSATLNQDFSPEYIRRAVEASLIRLGTDYIDIMMLHGPPQRLEFQDDLVVMLESLRNEGKILHYGISTEAIEDGVRPYLSEAVYQFPLTGPTDQVIEYANRLKQGCSTLIGREAFRYCREKAAHDAAFNSLLNNISDDFYDASLVTCLQTIPSDVLLVGMTRPETVLRNASFFDRMPREVLNLDNTV